MFEHSEPRMGFSADKFRTIVADIKKHGRLGVTMRGGRKHLTGVIERPKMVNALCLLETFNASGRLEHTVLGCRETSNFHPLAMINPDEPQKVLIYNGIGDLFNLISNEQMLNGFYDDAARLSIDGEVVGPAEKSLKGFAYDLLADGVQQASVPPVSALPPENQYL